MTELLVSALLTIAMSGGLVWLGMRYIARMKFSLRDTAVAAVLPVALVVPLEVGAAYFLSGPLVVVYGIATVLAIIVQAWLLRVLCRRRGDVLSRARAGSIAVLAMLGCILMGSPIYPLVLDRFFTPG